MAPAQCALVGGVNHAHAASAGGVEEPAQIRDEAGAVGGQCGQHRFGAKYTVLAFHADDGDGGQFRVPRWRAMPSTLGYLINNSDEIFVDSLTEYGDSLCIGRLIK